MMRYILAAWHGLITYITDLLTPEPIVVVPVTLHVESTPPTAPVDAKTAAAEREIFRELMTDEG
ncbi:MAG: hypothetical protein LKJ69_09690 [Lactobacillus sp.]|jgi:hypothetical protein|nr:hypothetical protein [Lactobacillus sp.]MCI2033633.1 hypothetical protein [Lactobacillus sp.]